MRGGVCGPVLSCFGLCILPCDINLQDGVLIVEPPPLGFHHMFGNKEVEVQVLETFADNSLKAMAMKLGHWDVTYYRY